MRSSGVGRGAETDDAELIPSVRMDRSTRPETATLSVPFSSSCVR